MSKPFGVVVSIAPLHLAGLWCLETNSWPWENHGCRKDKERECELCKNAIERTVIGQEPEPGEIVVQ